MGNLQKGCTGFSCSCRGNCWNVCFSTYLGNNERILCESLIGNYLGLGLVIITKVLILKSLQTKFFAAFYRKNPMAANIVTLAVECYSAAISIYFMVVRAIKVLVIGAMYIGRIDTPLFADGVGVFGPLEIGE